MKLLNILFCVIFILSPKIIISLIKQKQYKFAISAIMANPLIMLLFVPIFIFFGWIIGIVSIVTFMGLGFLYNMRLMHNSSEDQRPRKAIEAAEKVIECDTEENRAAVAAANVAWAAARDTAGEAVGEAADAAWAAAADAV